MTHLLCPCCSGQAYKDCCEIIIRHQSATTAEQLMRSRYSAFATADALYLYTTTHILQRQQFEDFKEITTFCQSQTWHKLVIRKTIGGHPTDVEGIVEFEAYHKDVNGKEQIIHERSNFVKENNQWFYVDGIHQNNHSNTTDKISRNAICPCGSGKKYKRCCL